MLTFYSIFGHYYIIKNIHLNSRLNKMNYYAHVIIH